MLNDNHSLGIVLINVLSFIKYIKVLHVMENMKHMIWKDIEEEKSFYDIIFIYNVTCAYKTFTALGRNRMWDEFK